MLDITERATCEQLLVNLFIFEAKQSFVQMAYKWRCPTRQNFNPLFVDCILDKLRLLCPILRSSYPSFSKLPRYKSVMAMGLRVLEKTNSGPVGMSDKILQCNYMVILLQTRAS